MSDFSGDDAVATDPSTPFSAPSSPNWHSYATPMPTLKQQGRQEPKSQQMPRCCEIPQGNFQLSHMMTVIECKSAQLKTVLPPLHPADEPLFRRLVDLECYIRVRGRFMGLVSNSLRDLTRFVSFRGIRENREAK